MANTTYQLPVWETITTAWQKVHGSKSVFWGAFGLMFAIVIGLGIAKKIIQTLIPIPGIDTLMKFFLQAIAYLLQIGMLYIGIKRAADLLIEYRQIFRPFQANIIIQIFLLYILQILIYLPMVLLLLSIGMIFTLLSTIGLGFLSILFFILAGLLIVYISIRIVLAPAFILDQSQNAWGAIKHSFYATRKNFWQLFAIYLIEFIIITISAIPFGIGLIWSLPFSLICYGLIYKNLQVNVSQ
ncbi:MAG: hypothetical protein ACD_46C00426G0004 [uncultured bacterium]|nr:MAG: hypothetical protein ACD_46C00426G0004 [uncultured bacterium]